MAKPKEKPKTNLLLEAAKKKAEAQASGKKNPVFDADPSSRFTTRGNKAQKPTKWGGRNGQGKPT